MFVESGSLDLWRAFQVRLFKFKTGSPQMANPTGLGGFRKGQTGNPGGRPRVVESLTREARLYTHEALRTLLKLMRSARSENVRLNAAGLILDRGWGKPVQAVQVDGRLMEKKLHEMTDAELAAFEARLLDATDEGAPDLFRNLASGNSSESVN
jgi:hypothetical protein